MPKPSRYFTAAPKPIAPAMLGVPASNFQGNSFQETLHCPCALAEGNFFYHFAAALKRRHLFEHFFFAIEHSDACWSKHFVPEKAKKSIPKS